MACVLRGQKSLFGERLRGSFIWSFGCARDGSLAGGPRGDGIRSSSAYWLASVQVRPMRKRSLLSRSSQGQSKWGTPRLRLGRGGYWGWLKGRACLLGAMGSPLRRETARLLIVSRVRCGVVSPMLPLHQPPMGDGSGRPSVASCSPALCLTTSAHCFAASGHRGNRPVDHHRHGASAVLVRGEKPERKKVPHRHLHHHTP